jgi:hypothetical protein
MLFLKTDKSVECFDSGKTFVKNNYHIIIIIVVSAAADLAVIIIVHLNANY